MQKGQNDEKMKLRWLGMALAYFHDLPIKTAKKVGDKDITTDDSGITVRVGESSYRIPHLIPQRQITYKEPEYLCQESSTT